MDEKKFSVIPDFICELRYKVTNRDGIKRPKIVTYWLAELINPQSSVSLSDEHQAYKWLPLKEAMDLNGFTDFNECLQKCAVKIGSL